MARTIRAAGDKWSVRLGESREGLRAVLFFCVTTDQRPYRVVEVPAERIDGPDALERMPEPELKELFAASSSLDYPRTYP